MSITERALAAMRPIPAPPVIPVSYPVGRGWYAVYCNIKCEVRAQMGLSAKGFGTFLPMETKRRVRRGKAHIVKLPVFSRYLFVSFDPDREEWWHPIRSTDGVESILEINGHPARIPTKVIEELQGIADAGGFDKDPLPKEGAEMRVTAGPYKFFTGKIKSASPNGRAKLLMKMFTGEVVVDFPLGALEQIR